jgi:hypothetical protein
MYSIRGSGNVTVKLPHFGKAKAPQDIPHCVCLLATVCKTLPLLVMYEQTDILCRAIEYISY